MFIDKKNAVFGERKLKDISKRSRFAIRKYLKYTSVNGFHYLIHSKFKLRIAFWLIVCLACIAFSLYLVYLQLIEYSTNVTSNPIKTTAYPIWKVPFPALTICNYNIVYKDGTKKFEELFLSEGFSPKNISTFFNKLGILIFCNDCDYAKGDFNYDMYEEMFQTLERENYDVYKLMETIAHPCEIMLKRCKWKSIEYPCRKLFRFARATNGICCSFNYYGSNDIQEEFTEDNFLLYAGGVGENSGIIVEIDIEEDQFVSAIKPLYAVEAIIHDNYAYPDFAYLSYTLWAGDSMTLGIYTNIIEADQSIRGVHPLKRGCWFEDEKELKSTRYYNYQTCLNECRAHYILEICHCVPYFVPKLEGRQCSLMDFPCLQRNEMRFSNIILNSSTSQDMLPIINKRINETFSCNCLFDCNYVTFEGHISKSDAKNNNSTLSVIKAFHNAISCTKRERVLNTTWDMLLASLGGIFGLCLGASICSVIELLYHILIYLLLK